MFIYFAKKGLVIRVTTVTTCELELSSNQLMQSLSSDIKLYPVYIGKTNLHPSI